MNGNSAGSVNGDACDSGLVYDRVGKGPCVILIHGWCLNSTMWMYAVDALRDDFEIVTVDLPGFGRAHSSPPPYSIERHADDLIALVGELQVKNVTLVGFAYGAAVALEAAARSESLFGGVVSVAVPSAPETPYEKMPRSMRKDWPDFARRSAKALFHNPQSEATLNWLERMFASAPLHVALDAVQVLARYDPIRTVPRVTVPMLFIHAQQDTVAPVRLGSQYAELAGSGRVEVVDDCGHLIVLDAKDRFHELTKAFIAAQLARQSSN